MPSALRNLHKVKSDTKLSAVKLEQERTPNLVPSISVIVLEILISFPWQ